MYETENPLITRWGRLGKICFTLACLAFAGAGVLYFRARAEWAELLLQQQKIAWEKSYESWRRDWIQFLLEKHKNNEIPKYCADISPLAYDWASAGLLPTQRGIGNWHDYEDLRKNSRHAEAEQLLRSWIQQEHTWLRIFALEEWLRYHRNIPRQFNLTLYELSLLFPEWAKKTESMWNELNSTPPEGQEVWWVDDMIFSLKLDGARHVCIPDRDTVTELLLPQFEARYRLSGLALGSSAFELILKTLELPKSPPVYREMLALIGTGGILLVISLFALYRLSFLQKQLISQRVSFLNQVVHEIRTPISGLKLHAQIMKKIGATPEILDEIEKSAVRIERIFDDLVYVSRPFVKADGAYITKEEISAVLQEFQQEYGENLYVANQPCSDVFIEPRRFRIILRNLISNGIRYGHKVTLFIRDEEERVSFLVSDDGPGITHKDAELIFQEFYRSPWAIDKDANGLGLGLAIARKLANETNAELVLENPGEKGACFRLTGRKKHEKSSGD